MRHNSTSMETNNSWQWTYLLLFLQTKQMEIHLELPKLKSKIYIYIYLYWSPRVKFWVLSYWQKVMDTPAWSSATGDQTNVPSLHHMLYSTSSLSAMMKKPQIVKNVTTFPARTNAQAPHSIWKEIMQCSLNMYTGIHLYLTAISPFPGGWYVQNLLKISGPHLSKILVSKFK